MRGVSFAFIHGYFIYMKRNSGCPFPGPPKHDMHDDSSHVHVLAFTFRPPPQSAARLTRGLHEATQPLS